MRRTFVNATINGPQMTKGYNFLVDTGATLMGLPSEEIKELGLTPVPDGKRWFMTAAGVVELDTYIAVGRIEGRGFNATVITAPVPLIGYEFLENLRFKVNPITHQLEEVPLDEPHPPYLLLINDV